MASISALRRELKQLCYPEIITLTHEQEIIREKCERSFYEFVRHGWIHIDGTKLKDGWHIQVLCEHLEAVYYMQIMNLLYNGPPRTAKSTIINCAFGAWVWIKNASLSFLHCSYGIKLTSRDSKKFINLVQSNWYQSLWGDRYKISKRERGVQRFNNDKFGSRMSGSVNSGVTGDGAEFRITDDPNNIKKIHSAVDRQAVHDWFDYTLSTRFKLAETARQIVSQQRGHMQDLSGHILAKNDPSWIHLCLPMEFEKTRRCVTIPLLDNKNTWMDPRKEEGELLCPELFSAHAIEKQKREWNYDPYTIASQYQQWPTPSEGGILKEDWFQIYKKRDLPDFKFIMGSWDTALTKGATSCFSAFTCWGVFEEKGIRNVMLLSAFQAKLDFAELMDMAKRLAYDYNDVYIDDAPSVYKNSPHNILIEGKANGHSLFQMLQKLNLPVALFNPTKYGDKISRCHQISHYVQNGLVWLTADYKKKFEYLTEDSEILLNAARNFPMDEDSADIIDSMTQALIELSRWNELKSREASIVDDGIQRANLNTNYDGLRRR